MCTIGILLLLPVVAGAAPQKIAVLELHNGAGLTADEADYLTDLVRRTALRLPRERYFVMTRENILEQLPPGTDLATCEGACEVETGRNVGADIVVSGEIIRFGGSLRVVLKAHDTHTSKLVAAESASGETVGALETPVEQTAGRLFAPLAVANTAQRRAVLGGGTVRRGVETDRGERIVNAITDDTGFLVITSSPSGAEVTVNGRRVGATPLQLEQMVGHYVVVAEKTGYHGARRELDLGADGIKVRLNLPPAFGRLEIETVPAGAQVWINGEMVGESPWSAPAKPSGIYKLRVEQACYRPTEREITVQDGEVASERVVLEEACGSLHVASTPPGARITLNGHETDDTTPHTYAGMQPGVAMIRLAREGYGTAVESAEIRTGEQSIAEIALQAKYGLLSVLATNRDGSPCQGELQIDGAVVGQTPWKGQLVATPHRVEVKCPSGSDAQQVIIKHNMRQRLELRANGAEVTTAPVGTVEPDGAELSFLLSTNGFRDFYPLQIVGWLGEHGFPVRPGAGISFMGIHRVEEVPAGFEGYGIGVFGADGFLEIRLLDPIALVVSTGITASFVACDNNVGEPATESEEKNDELCREVQEPNDDGAIFLDFGVWSTRALIELDLGEMAFLAGVSYRQRAGSTRVDIGEAIGVSAAIEVFVPQD